MSQSKNIVLRLNIRKIVKQLQRNKQPLENS